MSESDVVGIGTALLLLGLLSSIVQNSDDELNNLEDVGIELRAIQLLEYGAFMEVVIVFCDLAFLRAVKSPLAFGTGDSELLFGILEAVVANVFFHILIHYNSVRLVNQDDLAGFHVLVSNHKPSLVVVLANGQRSSLALEQGVYAVTDHGGGGEGEAHRAAQRGGGCG